MHFNTYNENNSNVHLSCGKENINKHIIYNHLNAESLMKKMHRYIYTYINAFLVLQLFVLFFYATQIFMQISFPFAPSPRISAEIYTVADFTIAKTFNKQKKKLSTIVAA